MSGAERQRRYRERNLEKVRAGDRASYHKHAIKRRATTSAWKRRHRAKVNKSKRAYYLRNRPHPEFRLAGALRRRVNDALRRGTKAGSAVRDLGCTISALRAYLESKFQPGMTWKNWGRNGWHIDHVKPLASFDLTDRQQFLVACHYTNLQPLWAEENLKKGAEHVEVVGCD